MSLPFVKRVSDWSYLTSATMGIGLGYFAASGGKIALVDPATHDRHNPRWLHYAGAGAGLSVGMRGIPKIGHALDPLDRTSKASSTIAPSQFTSHGIVLVMNSCENDELTIDDFGDIVAL